MGSGSGRPSGDTLLSLPAEFSLVLGGPLFQLLRRAHLCDDALLLQRRRVLVIALVAWLPLLGLSALSGRLFGPEVAVPFLLDVDVHVKFLLAMPLLIAAELIVHQRMRTLLATFRQRSLIPDGESSRFDAAIESAFRLRNSVTAEVLLIAFVYVVGVTIVWRQYMALDTATWYATPTDDGTRLTLAGMWYGYVSLPIFQFLLCRWYFRMFIWARMLWRVSRIRLDLVPTHPDRLGGLGFLAATSYAFVPLLAAHGALLAGNLANQIFHAGASLPQFRLEILLLVILMVLLVVGPLLVFSPQLAQARRNGLREYGTLAQDYVRAFGAKWVHRADPADEAMLGSGDIQSLADLGNAHAVIQEMRIVPVSRQTMIQLAVATVAPITPLVLTLMPLEELLRKLLGILF